MPKPTLVVMAAGIGSRYGGLKQIDPIGPSGEIILDYSVYDAKKAGFGKVVFIIRREIEQAFREKVGRHLENKIDTSYVFQELTALPKGFRVPAERTKPLGTGHAILCCKNNVDGPFAVVNADDFYGAESFALLGHYLSSAQDKNGRFDFCNVGYRLGNTVSDHGHVARGVCQVDDNGFLQGIQERTRIEKRGSTIAFSEDEGQNWTCLPESTTVSMNMWGFTPGLFPELETRFKAFLEKNQTALKAEFFIPIVTGELVAENKAKIKVLQTGSRWVGVTYKEDLPGVKQAIRDLVARGDYPEQLWH